MTRRTLLVGSVLILLILVWAPRLRHGIAQAVAGSGDSPSQAQGDYGATAHFPARASAGTNLYGVPVLSSDPNPVRFAVVGDYGSPHAAADDVARLVTRWNPDFVMTTGDNDYPSGEASTIHANVAEPYGDWISPLWFFPTLGNHDWDSPDARPYLDFFTLPGNERYYEFVWGPVHFFALDSDPREPDGVDQTSVQAAWLERRMAASEAAWQIVYMHHPPFSSAEHGSSDWMQWPFAGWGADAVLAGHDHLYERILHDGIPYIVDGLGGHGIYQFRDAVPGSQRRYNGDYGALFVEATSDQLTFEFINRDAEVIDAFTLVWPPP